MEIRFVAVVSRSDGSVVTHRIDVSETGGRYWSDLPRKAWPVPAAMTATEVASALVDWGLEWRRVG